MTRTIVLGLICAAVWVPTAQADHNSRWYWNPGWCKAQLQQGGVQLADGRYFYVAKAFCVGLGGPRYCEWNRWHSSRDYAGFYTILRSYDGNVRTMFLYPTGRDSFRGTNIRLIERMSSFEFDLYVRRVAKALARGEHEKGCAPYRG